MRENIIAVDWSSATPASLPTASARRLGSLAPVAAVLDSAPATCTSFASAAELGALEWWNILPKSPDEVAAAVAGEESAVVARALEEHRQLRALLAQEGDVAREELRAEVSPQSVSTLPAAPPFLAASTVPVAPPLTSDGARLAYAPTTGDPDDQSQRGPAPAAAKVRHEHAGFGFFTGNSDDVGPSVGRALQSNHKLRHMMQDGSFAWPIASGHAPTPRPVSDGKRVGQPHLIRNKHLGPAEAAQVATSNFGRSMTTDRGPQSFEGCPQLSCRLAPGTQCYPLPDPYHRTV